MDYRERISEIPDLLREAGFSIAVRALRCGDYRIGDSIIVERKTHRDFLRSIIDGRLFKQLWWMKRSCSRPLLLIEGNLFNTGLAFDGNAIRGAVLSVQAIWHVPVVLSKDPADTRDVIIMIVRQEKNSSDAVPQRQGYRPKRLRSRQLFILQGLPKVGPVMAKRLLGHFGSVRRVMSASVEELSQVIGIGRGAAESIRNVLDSSSTHPSPRPEPAPSSVEGR